MKHTELPKKILHIVCDVLELIAAALMIIGIVLAVIGLINDGELFRNLLSGDHAFMVYVERVFAIVIGVEFLEMLCKPTPDKIIQTLIFLVARHMIVGETTPVQDFVSIASIVVLFLLKRWLQADGDKNAAPLISIRHIHEQKSADD